MTGTPATINPSIAAEQSADTLPVDTLSGTAVPDTTITNPRVAIRESAPTSTEHGVDSVERSTAAHNDGRLYGYVRVSTREQNEARQIIALREFGVSQECMYMDKQSEKDFKRPAWQELLSRLTAGDVLVVKSIDRLGRNYSDMIKRFLLIHRLPTITDCL
jgi:hypothetical protein